jgi:hypothetical protein
MMTVAALLLACAFLGGTPDNAKVLLVLETGEDLFGEIVVEKEDHVFIKTGGKVVRVDQGQVARRVKETEIGAEIQEREKALAEGDARGCLRLALLCLEVGRESEARPLIDRARAYLDVSKQASPPAGPKKSAPDAGPKKSAPDAAGTPAPWPPADGARFVIDVKKKITDQVSDDLVRRSSVQLFFKDAGSQFVVAPSGSTGNTYTMNIGVEARMLKTQSFFGGVPVSREWEGRVRCVVRHAATGKEVFRLSPPAQKASFSAYVRGEEEVLNVALDHFLNLLRKEPAFRFKKASSMVE